MEVSLSLIYPRTRPLERHSFVRTRAFGTSITRLSSLKGLASESPRRFCRRWRNARSETVRAEDRAVTESVARSRALHFCPLLHLALAPSLALSPSRSGETPLRSSRSRLRDKEECSSQLPSIRYFIPVLVQPFSPPPPARSLLLLHYFHVLVLRTCRSYRFILRNNTVHIFVFVSLPHPVYARIHPLAHTLVSSLRVRCTREHPTQSATPTPSVYVPLMREGNLA